MKQLKNLLFVLTLTGGIAFAACKGKTKSNEPTTTTTNVDSSATTTIPVEIAPDETLQNGVRDATKDYPGVNASVSNGEITLTGEITRDKLANLMQSLNSLQPKKINNNLTIK